MFDNLPKLGFGMMRLPKDENENLDISRITKMVDSYIKEGFNYFDTAYLYCNGQSESAIKEAIVDRYPRDAYILTDKLSIWAIDENKTPDFIFEDQLRKTGVDYFDIYLLHSVETKNYQQYEELDLFNWALKKKEEGKIKHFGFSFHGTPELLDELLERHPEVEIVQLQLNYIDWESPTVQSRRCYEVAKKYNKPILVMEPIKAGALARMSEGAEKIMKEVRPEMSIASWALRYVGSLENVVTILSGMSVEEHVEDNLKTMKNFESLSEVELRTVQEAIEILAKEKRVQCTDCKYCTDKCPMGIQIPEIFKALNVRLVRKEKHPPLNAYKKLIESSPKASECLKCGACEGVCPQHLNIIKHLEDAVKEFE